MVASKLEIRYIFAFTLDSGVTIYVYYSRFDYIFTSLNVIVLLIILIEFSIQLICSTL